MPVTTTYRPEIDGLRAVAVLAVVFYHAEFEFFSGGFVGVDVFFVISGYLIGRILIAELADGGFSYAGFFERRARRILPALFFMLLLVVLPAYVLLPPADLQNFANSLLGATWFSSNFIFWAEAGYFDRGSEVKPLLHTWSLAVEEQFYLVFPLLLATLVKLKKVIAGLVLGVVMSLALALLGLSAGTDWPFFMLASRAWELGLGALVAALAHQQSLSRLYSDNRLEQLWPLLGMVGIVTAILTFSEATPTPGLPLVLPTAGTALLLLVHSPGGWIAQLLSHPLLSSLGLVSYSFYLWHQPILVLSRFHFRGDLTPLMTWAALFGALLLAVLSWKFIEQPFRNRDNLSRKYLIVSLSLCAFVLTGLGVYIKATGGLRERVASVAFGDAGHSEYYRFMDAHFMRCSDEKLLYRIEAWEDVPRCHQSHGSTPVQVAFFGDSHAEQLFLGAEPLLNTRSIYLIRGGLPFVKEDRFKSPIYYLQEQDSLEVVVFSAYWTEKIALMGRDTFVLRVFETVKWLVEQDLQVVLMMDTPDFGFGPDRCIYSDDAASNCHISAERHKGAQSQYGDIFQKIAKHPDVELIDVSDVVCDDGKCRMISDNTLLYRDNDHLNLIGSDLAGRSLVSKSEFLKTYVK